MRIRLARKAITRVLTALAVTAGAGALALAPASAAAAHDYLVSSDPAAGSTVTAPIHTVKLTFNDIVLDLSGDGTSSIVQVTGPDGASRHFETGCAKAVGRVVTAPVALGGPGSYQVEWQIVSADGHTVSQKLDFTYRPPADVPRAKGTESRPSCGAAGTTSTTAATAPVTNGSADSGNLGIVIGLAGGIIGLAVIAVIIVLLTGRRRPRGTTSWQPDKE
jgi:hypothetical protein